MMENFSMDTGNQLLPLYEVHNARAPTPKRVLKEFLDSQSFESNVIELPPFNQNIPMQQVTKSVEVKPQKSPEKIVEVLEP
jgi:hypothetical protein